MRCEAHLVEEEPFEGECTSTSVMAMLDDEWRSSHDAR